MKWLSLVLLREKEFLHERNSILIAPLGIPSIWGHRTTSSRRSFFCDMNLFESGEIRVVKKIWYPGNEWNQLITSSIIFFQPIPKRLTSLGSFPENRKFFSIHLKTISSCLFDSAASKTGCILRIIGPTYQKPDSLSKGNRFSILKNKKALTTIWK